MATTSKKRVTGMSGNERLDSKAGPLGNLSQAYFGGLDKMVKGCEPALKGVGRWNLELFGLMTRRSQAWLEMPARLGRCKTPVEVFGEQMRFWQTAAADYADGWQRLAAAWGACAVDAEAQRLPAARLHDGRRAPGAPRLPTSAASARRPEASVVQFVRSTGWLRTRPAETGSRRGSGLTGWPPRQQAWRVAATGTPCLRACSLRSPAGLQQRHADLGGMQRARPRLASGEPVPTSTT